FPAGLADLLLADHDLDAAGPVADVEEVHLALAAAEHDPPGDAHRRAGIRVRPGPIGRGRRAHLADRPVAVGPLAPRVNTQLRDLAELLHPHVFQALPRLVRHRSPYVFSIETSGITWANCSRRPQVVNCKC